MSDNQNVEAMPALGNCCSGALSADLAKQLIAASGSPEGINVLSPAFQKTSSEMPMGNCCSGALK
jgi:hypothetical protein